MNWNHFLAGWCAVAALNAAIDGRPWLVLLNAVVCGLNLYWGRE